MKHDLRQVRGIANRFDVDVRTISDYIHDIKSGFDGNPNLQFGRDGSIFLGNEWVGSVLDVRLYGKERTYRHDFHWNFQISDFITSLISFFRLN